MNGIDLTPLQELLKDIQAGVFAEPEIITLYLDTARTNYPINLAGFELGVVDSSAGAEVDIRFNRPGTDPVTFKKGLKTKRPFVKAFVSHAAQAGEWVKIWVSPNFLYTYDDDREQADSTASLAEIQDNTELLKQIPSIATEVNARASSINTAGDATLYTVGVGKILKITSAGLSHARVGNVNGHLFITDASDVWVKDILMHYVQADSSNGQNINFLPALHVPAGYKIKVGKQTEDFTASTSGWAMGFFNGYLV